MAIAEGAALRAFDVLERTLPAMRTTISRVMPTCTAILDDAMPEDFDDRRLARDLRYLALCADRVSRACTTLEVGTDLTDELFEI
jgi:hypothetical protein